MPYQQIIVIFAVENNISIKYSDLNKQVLRLAVPSILANITIPLVGIVDTAIAGHISNSAAIGGIAIGTMLFDLLYWNFGFLRVGTAGMTAQHYGANNLSRARQILLQSLSIALAGAFTILLLQWLFVNLALYLVPCSNEVAHFAKQYFYIRIWAAPATLCLMAFKGWFIGMQNTIATMTTDLIVNVVNIIASWILAVHTSLGALGVAYGTLIAQYAGLTTAIIILFCSGKHYIQVKQTSIPFLQYLSDTLSWNKLKRLFVLNSNLFVRSLCFMVVYVGFTSIASKYGDNELAVSAIMMKLFMLFSYFIDGFAYAGEALTGRFIGEHNNTSLTVSVKILFIWTIALGLICTLVYGIIGTGMIGLMTNQQELITASQPYVIWLILMPLISCLAFMWDGIYVGATAGKEMRNCMIWSAVCFLLSYIALQNIIGIQALYLAYFVHLAVRTLYLTAKWKTTMNKYFYSVSR